MPLSEDRYFHGITLWHRRDLEITDRAAFGQVMDCAVDDDLWNGLNVRAPVIYFGEGSALARPIPG
jgi:hypothetical protein